MIREEIRKLRTGKSDLRKFGLTVGGVFTAVGLFLLVRHGKFAPLFIGLGLALVISGLVIPTLLKQIYIGWMSVAIVLGNVVSRLILTLFFILIITPVALTARLLGKQFLELELDRDSASYWKVRQTESGPLAKYEQQF